MNAQFAQFNSQAELALPLPNRSSDSRRRRVGSLVLEDDAVARFNRLITDIACEAPSICGACSTIRTGNCRHRCASARAC